MSADDDLLKIPSFLKRPPLTAEQKAALDREDKETATRWHMPVHAQQKGSGMTGDETTTTPTETAAAPKAKRTRKPNPPPAPPVEINVKFRDVMQELGVDVTTRAGRNMALAVADDAEKARALLSKFSGIDAEPLTGDEAKAQAEATIRAELQLPTVMAAHEGDETMTAAVKKVAKRAAKTGTKAPRAAVRKSGAAAERKPRQGTGKPREGAVGICAEILKLISRAKGATTQECLAALVEKFPKRDKSQMHNTVRGELQNIPRRLKGKMKKEKVDGRKGKVYYWTPKD